MDRTCRACGGNKNYKIDENIRWETNLATQYLMEVRIILKCITGNTVPWVEHG
jgi:hypothetical protein